MALVAIPTTGCAQLTADKRMQNLGTLQLYSEATTSFKIKNTANTAVNVAKIVTSSAQIKATCSPMLYLFDGFGILRCIDMQCALQIIRLVCID